MSSLEDKLQALTRSLEDQGLLSSGEGQSTDTATSERLNAASGIKLAPPWGRIALATLLSAVLPVLLFIGVILMNIPVPEPPADLLLSLLIFALVVWPIPLAGYWAGIAWSSSARLSRFLAVQTALALASIALGLLVYRVGAALVLDTESLLGTTPYQTVLLQLTNASASTSSWWISLLGPILIFISGGLFADLRKKRKLSASETQPGLARTIANKFSTAGEEPSTNLVKVIEIVGPSLVGLFGTILTIYFN